MKGRKAEIFPGDKFGRLAVLRELHRQGHSRIFSCVCLCGKKVVTDSSKLLSGNTKSCGCLRKEITSALTKKHGMTGTRIYRVWRGIKSRCLYPRDPAFLNYGARGIEIYGPWLEFSVFHAWAVSSGYSDNLTIERIDNNGSYHPGNCTWIPRSQQSKNRRMCVFLEHEGLRMTVSDWARKLGVKRETIKDRLREGWSVSRALTEPVHLKFSSAKG